MSAKNGRPTAEMILPQHETEALCPECNPPAFPVVNLNDGMSLRDYFAAAALQGLCATNQSFSNPELLAKYAFSYAEAMLKERGL